MEVLYRQKLMIRRDASELGNIAKQVRTSQIVEGCPWALGLSIDDAKFATGLTQSLCPASG
jgi:hypothetical protein